MLIFDVGMHNGDDTAYYLSLGHRVVAVEANPELCEQAAQRFATAVDAGRVVIEKVAIAPASGLLPFYVTEGATEFSALDREQARHGSHAIREITVEAVAIASLFERHGIPDYLKVDIERGDSECLDALAGLDVPPQFVSVEAHSLDYLCRLWAVGYRRFKVVDQLAHNSPARGHNESIGGRVTQTIGHYLARACSRKQPGRYAAGSSGPFGDNSPGDWQDLETVAYNWLHFQTGHRRRGTLNPRSWFDFHAKR